MSIGKNWIHFQFQDYLYTVLRNAYMYLKPLFKKCLIPSSITCKCLTVTNLAEIDTSEKSITQCHLRHNTYNIMLHCAIQQRFINNKSLKCSLKLGLLLAKLMVLHFYYLIRQKRRWKNTFFWTATMF